MSDELFDELDHLIETEPLGVLATQHADGPHASLIAVTPGPDRTSLYFVTERDTRKYAYLTASGRIALLIDSRSRSGTDIASGRAVTIYGRAEEATTDDVGTIQERHLARHPYLAPFLSSGTSAFIRIEVESYSLVLGFSEVWDLNPQSGTWTNRNS